ARPHSSITVRDTCLFKASREGESRKSVELCLRGVNVERDNFAKFQTARRPSTSGAHRSLHRARKTALSRRSLPHTTVAGGYERRRSGIDTRLSARSCDARNLWATKQLGLVELQNLPVWRPARSVPK